MPAMTPPSELPLLVSCVLDTPVGTSIVASRGGGDGPLDGCGGGEVTAGSGGMEGPALGSEGGGSEGGAGGDGSGESGGRKGGDGGGLGWMNVPPRQAQHTSEGSASIHLNMLHGDAPAS